MRASSYSISFLGLAVGGFMLAVACANKPPPKSPDDLGMVGPDGGAVTNDGGAATDGGAGPPASVCSGPDLDLQNVLVQSACEVKTPEGQKARDTSGLLEVKAMALQSSVSPGGHVDVVVTYANKSKDPLTLDFLLDPTPRFSIEAYNAINKRVDRPLGNPPHGASASASEPSAPGTAEVIIPPGAKATAKVGWDAVKTRWAPELVKGTPPEQGYPTAPNGKLPKGKYTLKVVTPLTGVFEGSDHEVSTAKTTITVQ